MAKKKKKYNRSLRHHNHRRKVENREYFFSVELEKSMPSDYVLINAEEMDYISRYILDYPQIETGGQLFGYWTYDGKPVVLFVLGPGPKAGHYNTFFMQDINYLKECADILNREYGLNHIGEWHSHHQLGLSKPSAHDAKNISSNMRALGYKKFLLCIATCTSSESSVNAYIFDLNKSEYEQIPWLIKQIRSPYRKIAKNKSFLLPKTQNPKMVNLLCKLETGGSTKIDYDKAYWLKDKANSLVLKSIIDFLKQKYPISNLISSLDGSNEAHIEIYQNENLFEDIHFSIGFPMIPPIIIDSSGRSLGEQKEWVFNGDILSSFVLYYNNRIKS